MTVILLISSIAELNNIFSSTVLRKKGAKSIKTLVNDIYSKNQ